MVKLPSCGTGSVSASFFSVVVLVKVKIDRNANLVYLSDIVADSGEFVAVVSQCGSRCGSRDNCCSRDEGSPTYVGELLSVGGCEKE